MRSIAHRLALRPLLSAAIAVGPIAAVFVVAGSAYMLRWDELSNRIESSSLEIQKVGWIAANSEQLSIELAAAEKSQSPGVLVASGDPDLAAADLQKSIKTLLDSATMQISSIQPLSVSDENGVRFVSVRAQASGSYENVLAFLNSTYASTPPALIAAVDLMPDPTQSVEGKAQAAKYLLQFEAVRLMAAGQ